jgi:hypothetical protein
MGGAFGIAIVGSAFTARYRGSISAGLRGLPAPVASAARQAPAVALQVAGRLGPDGRALTQSTKAAFMTGQRGALLIGAVTLAIGVAFLTLRRAAAPVPEVEDGWGDADELDLELAS